MHVESHFTNLKDYQELLIRNEFNELQDRTKPRLTPELTVKLLVRWAKWTRHEINCSKNFAARLLFLKYGPIPASFWYICFSRYNTDQNNDIFHIFWTGLLHLSVGGDRGLFLLTLSTMPVLFLTWCSWTWFEGRVIANIFGRAVCGR